MITKGPMLKRLVLAAVASAWCAANLHAQTAPTITNQPASQTNLAGSKVVFSVAVDGFGPFTYQWQFNGVNLPTNIITTVAGDGNAQDVVNGDAMSTSLCDPYGVALDVAGNLYIADTCHNRIRNVDSNGIMGTIAGNGEPFYSGDGGAAPNADVNSPQGVAVDGFGNIYIAEGDNQRVRKVDTQGIITTVAGDGDQAYAGDGGAATNASLDHPFAVSVDFSGNLFIADTWNHRIRKVDTNGIITTVAGDGDQAYAGDGAAATNASLNYPGGVSVDFAGNLFIADTENNRIRKVGTNGIITTVAGNGEADYSGDGGAATNGSLNNPQSVAVDGFGNLYIADSYNTRIRKVDNNGIITTIAGNGIKGYAGDGGASTNASINEADGVGVDVSGNLYIADTPNSRIRKVWLYGGNPALTLINVGASSAGGYSVIITSPYGSVTSAVATLTVQAPPIITVQPVSQKVTAGSNSLFSVAVAGSGPFGYSWYISNTNLIQSETNSTLALSDVSTNETGEYMVVVTNAYGGVTSQVATLTVGLPPTVSTPPGGQTNLAGTNVTFSVVVDGTGPFSYQWQFNGTNLPNDIITTVAGSGVKGFAGDGDAATNASLDYPTGVAFDAAGNLYIADTDNERIRKVDTNGIITTVAGNGTAAYAGDGQAATNANLHYPWDLVLDTAGNLYFADTYNSRIRKVATNGIITTVAGNGTAAFGGDGGAATNASLNYPYGVALDAAGTLYISDGNNNRIRKVDVKGIISTVAGGGYEADGKVGDGSTAAGAVLYNPSQIAFDSAGDLYIADSSDNRIRKVGANGIITTVAGNGAEGSAGDGDDATNASFDYPTGVALDGYGDLYIADYSNNRVREVNTNGIINTIAGGGTAYPGNGGAATNANIGGLYSGPQRVALDAAGNLYFGETKGNRIHEVHLAGFPTLTLSGVNTNDSGNYTVIVASPYGSVTSAVAALTVTIPNTPPLIITNDANFGFLTNQFGFDVSGAFGQTIVVEGSTNLVDWTPLSTNIGGGGPFYFFDPASTNSVWRFYRARLPR